MKSRETLARNLRFYRVKKGLSQEGLSFSAGIDRTYVSGIERGQRNPTLDVLDDLAAALDLEPIALLEKRPKIGSDLRLRSGRKPK